MPNIDGISVAKQLRLLDPATLLVYISSYDQYLRQLFEVGVFRFLDKPVDYSQLSECFLDACHLIAGMHSYLNIHTTENFSAFLFGISPILKVIVVSFICILEMENEENFIAN